MMEAKELRIGNLILCKGNDIDTGEPLELECEVESLPMNREADYYIGANFPSEENCKCEGIPLTEEWLKKFGFEYEQPTQEPVGYDEDGNIDYHDTGDSWNKKKGAFHGVHKQNDNWYHGGVKIEYVHQLQNLYFALTGEELQIQHKSK